MSRKKGKRSWLISIIHSCVLHHSQEVLKTGIGQCCSIALYSDKEWLESDLTWLEELKKQKSLNDESAPDGHLGAQPP
eukprot:3375710-Amphidinium_carterae.1